MNYYHRCSQIQLFFGNFKGIVPMGEKNLSFQIQLLRAKPLPMEGEATVFIVKFSIHRLIQRFLSSHILPKKSHPQWAQF